MTLDSQKRYLDRFYSDPAGELFAQAISGWASDGDILTAKFNGNTGKFEKVYQQRPAKYYAVGSAGPDLDRWVA